MDLVVPKAITGNATPGSNQTFKKFTGGSIYT